MFSERASEWGWKGGFRAASWVHSSTVWCSEPVVLTGNQQKVKQGEGLPLSRRVTMRLSPRWAASHNHEPTSPAASTRNEPLLRSDNEFYCCVFWRRGEERKWSSRAHRSVSWAWLGNGSALWEPHWAGSWSRGAANSCWSSSDPSALCWFSISTWPRGWSVSAPRTVISRKRTKGTSSPLRTPTTLRNTTSPSGTWRGRSISRSKGRTWSCFCTSRRLAGLPSVGTLSRMSVWRFRATADRARRNVPATGRTARRPGSSPGFPPAGAAACTPTGPSSPTVCRGSSTRRRTSRKLWGEKTKK